MLSALLAQKEATFTRATVRRGLPQLGVVGVGRDAALAALLRKQTDEAPLGDSKTSGPPASAPQSRPVRDAWVRQRGGPASVADVVWQEEPLQLASRHSGGFADTGGSGGEDFGASGSTLTDAPLFSPGNRKT